MSAARRLGAISAGCCAAAIAGCAHHGPAGDNREFADRIVTPLCANAHPPIVLEVRSVRDPQPRKPSAGLRHYLVDLRIRRKDRHDADAPRAPAHFEPYCTTWIDLTGGALSHAR